MPGEMLCREGIECQRSRATREAARKVLEPLQTKTEAKHMPFNSQAAGEVPLFYYFTCETLRLRKR